MPPTPAISDLSPANVSAGNSKFTLKVTGSGFVSNSIVYWGTTPLTTQFISDTQFSAQVAASDVSNAGIYGVTVQLLAPGGGTSNEFQFAVNSIAAGGSGAPSFSSTTATVPAGAAAAHPGYPFIGYHERLGCVPEYRANRAR